MSSSAEGQCDEPDMQILAGITNLKQKRRDPEEQLMGTEE